MNGIPPGPRAKAGPNPCCFAGEPRDAEAVPWKVAESGRIAAE